MPLQIVEGHYLFSTKWVGLDDGISTNFKGDPILIMQSNPQTFKGSPLAE